MNTAEMKDEGLNQDEKVSHFCPLFLYGQINGIYYFYGQNCTDCGFYDADHNRNHVIDNYCDDCTGGGGLHCSDGFSVPFREEGLKRYIPPRGSADPNGIFGSPGLHVRVTQDFPVKFFVSGRPYYARLLLVSLTAPDLPGGGPRYNGFGQQLEHAPTPEPPIAVYVPGSLSFYRLKVRYAVDGTDRVFTILMKDLIEARPAK